MLVLKLGIDGVLYDSRDSFHMIEINVRLARELDQIAPNSIRTGKTVPNAHSEITQMMYRHIAALNFISGAAKYADQVGRHISIAAPRQNSHHLRQTR